MKVCRKRFARRYAWVQLFWETFACRNVSVEIGKSFEEVGAHGPSIQISHARLELGRDAEVACFEVAFVTVPKLILPNEQQVRGEVFPEAVGTISVLGEDEAFAEAWPKITFRAEDAHAVDSLPDEEVNGIRVRNCCLTGPRMESDLDLPTAAPAVELCRLPFLHPGGQLRPPLRSRISITPEH